MTLPAIRVKALITAADAIVQAAREFTITDDDGFRMVDEHRSACVMLEKKIHASCDPVVDAANKTHKAATKQRNDLLAPVVEAKRIDGQKLAAYELAREVETRRLAEIDRLRIEAEKQRILDEADQLEAAGNIPAAAAVLRETFDLKPSHDYGAPKLSGTAFRDEWDFEITDRPAVPRSFLMVDEQAVRATVKAMKDRTDIPGVRAFCTKVPVTKGGRS
jgi:hypothetical protein